MPDSHLLIFDIYEDGELARTERLDQDVVKIGSHAKSHLRVEGEGVSRVHAVVEKGEEAPHIIDLGSAHGTFVNEERVNKADLGHGDRVRIGTVEIVFRTHDPEPEVEEEEDAQAAMPRYKRVRDQDEYARRFLSRPARTDGSVELAILYHDHVLDQRVFKPPRRVTLGAEDSDFLVEHPALGGRELPIIDVVGDRSFVTVRPDMAGEVYVGTDYYTLSDFIASGQAESAGSNHRVPLTESTRVRVAIGELTIFIHQTVKPELALPIAFGRGSSAPYVIVSGVIHALLLLLIFMLPPGVDRLNLDNFDADDRFVQILVQDPVPEEEDLSREEFMEDEEDQDDAEAGDEGKAGDERVEDEVEREMAVEGDNEPDEPTELQRAEAREEALQTGALAAMTAAGGPQSLFGGDAAGYQDVMAIGSQTGDSVGASYGQRGLGRYGGGISAGGRSTRGGFGAGTIALRGRSSGERDVELGQSLRRTSEREVRRVSVQPGTPEIRGQLDREIIQRIIREHRREVRACYEAELQRSPDLSGRVMVYFAITPDGSVATSNIRESSLGNSEVENCIAQRVRRWTFPEPRGGGIVHVNYPFVFTAGGR